MCGCVSCIEVLDFVFDVRGDMFFGREWRKSVSRTL